MVEQKVEFRKIRDFGENLNDTFLFIRQNFKPLITSFFAICGVFFLGQAIFTGLYLSRTFSVFGQLRNPGMNPPNMNILFSGDYFLVLLFGWLAYTAMKVALAAYIKYYTEHNGVRPGIEDIWTIFKKYFFKVFLYSIPLVMVMIVGYFFCLVPGIYLSVVLLPFELALIIEDASFGQAWDRCFSIIKDNFWISLATYLVAGLIYWISSGIISAVIGAITGIGAFFTTVKISPAAGIISSFFNIFASVFFIIFYVSIALNYFNLVEHRDGTGILSRIDAIGSDKNNFDNIEEQY